jgi:Ca-activated chloride channel family protein
MKKHLIILALVILTLAAVAGPARADGLIIPRPRPPQPQPSLRSLTVKEHHVTVTIDNQVATTRVDQTFINETAYEIEGEYIFPLPDGANISRFAMWVDGKRLEAEVLDRDRAQRIYEDIVRQQRDPALLEYMGRNAFRARIYPIAAWGEKRVEIEYSELLTADQGLVRYTYPLNTEKFSLRPLKEVSVQVNIASRQPLQGIYSPSHEVRVQRDGQFKASARYAEQDTTPDQDFVLYYQINAQELGANVLSYREGNEDGFFLLLLAPQDVVRQQAIVAKDVFFVLDTSGSMRGEKLTQAKEAAKYVLDNLNPDDRFNIIAFSSGTNAYASAARPAREVDEARSFIENLRASGGTNIDRALQETLSQTRRDRPQVIIFLTDGLATEGERATEKIIARVDERARDNVRIFAFGVGYDVNTLLLDTVTQGHHGTSAYVRPAEDIEQAVSSFYDKIGTPVLTDVTVDFGSLRVQDTFPYPLPDLFAGSQVVVVGRYRQGGAADLTLRGTVNGKPASYLFKDVQFREHGGDEFIPRLWATRKIGHLLTQIRLHGAESELVDEIVDLSVRYGIVTPYTSFLIDETEDALTAEGRSALAQKEVARAAAPYGLGGKGAGQATPSVSGAAAVEKSIAQESLRQADVAAPTEHQQVRTVGDRTFVLRDGIWTDTLYDAASAGESPTKAERVVFGGARYFELLRAHPEWGRYLALGQQVILVSEGRAYRFAPAS